jgi:hypothetical protein
VKDHLHESVCPHCDVRFDGLLGLTGEALPKDDDVMLCGGCGCFSVWHDGVAVKPTTTEWDYIGRDPYLQRAQLAWMSITSRP